MINASGQNIDLTYTAINNTAHVQLDSIMIKDLETGNKTTLIWPDTIYSMSPTNNDLLFVGYATFSPVGIYDTKTDEARFELLQNYPNPVKEQSAISMYLPEKGQARILIHDLQGRLIYDFVHGLEKGLNVFSFYPGKEKFYLFTAIYKNNIQSIKILVENNHPNNYCSLDYIGSYEYEPIINKSQPMSSGVIRESGIVDNPGSSNQDYVFQFAYNIPCPGISTITYEGQVYNTVQILSQCWLKENLNVGVMIDNEQNSEDNGIIEKYCCQGSEDTCAKYGGLYQWSEMMEYTTPQGAQGICPPGWHIPTDEEWVILEGATDSEYLIGDDLWYSNGSWRGSDVGINLKAGVYWQQNGNGNDSFGFRALPGADNDLVYMSVPGKHGLFWSSTYLNTYGPVYRHFAYADDNAKRATYNLEIAFSVRCVKD